jgi:2-oxoglutarate ferredoxin oxidoreductase subunit beta
MKYHPMYTCLVEAIKKANVDPVNVCVVSDFLYQPEVADYLGVDTFHIHRGRAVAFGTGLKLGNPNLKVVAMVGDLITLGGNHFMHAARRNMDLFVICVNNFIYPKIAGEAAPGNGSSFSPYATFERPPNVPHVARSCGAVYVARWTALHNTELTKSMAEALQRSGFSTIEVISPGTSYFPGIQESERASDLLKFYHSHSVIKNGEDTRNVEIDSDKEIIVGKFFERKEPTFIDSYNARLTEILGDKFKPYG